VPSRVINMSLPNSRLVDRLRAEAERERGRTVSVSEVTNALLDDVRERLERDDVLLNTKTLLPQEP